jgi:hypothetical protein
MKEGSKYLPEHAPTEEGASNARESITKRGFPQPKSQTRESQVYIKRTSNLRARNLARSFVSPMPIGLLPYSRVLANSRDAEAVVNVHALVFRDMAGHFLPVANSQRRFPKNLRY